MDLIVVRSTKHACDCDGEGGCMNNPLEAELVAANTQADMCHEEHVRAQVELARMNTDLKVARLERDTFRAALADCVKEIQDLMSGTTLLSWSVPQARRVLGEIRDASQR